MIFFMIRKHRETNIINAREVELNRGMQRINSEHGINSHSSDLN